jgi:RND family efflux transporter MFP subunit
MNRAIFFAAIGAVVVLQLACGHASPPGAAERMEIDGHVMAVELSDFTFPFETGGVVRARTTASVVSRVMAEVREVRAAPGVRVRAGQVLVLLDSREPEAQKARASASEAAARQSITLAEAGLSGARANLALAEATHRRIAQLHERRSATQHELDEAVAALRGAEARLQSAEARRQEATAAVEAASASLRAATVAHSYSALTAPFDGIVTEKLVDPGNMASPGMPLLRLEDASSFRFEVRIDASRAAYVNIGTPVVVTLDTLLGARPEDSQSLIGHVAEVTTTVDTGSHAFLVKADLPSDGRLRSGVFARAQFPGPSRPAIVVPASSVVRRGQLAMVFVVDDEMTARMRLVSISQPFDGRVEIRSGLEAGERIVLEPPSHLRDGAVVRTAGAPRVTRAPVEEDRNRQEVPR